MEFRKEKLIFAIKSEKIENSKRQRSRSNLQNKEFVKMEKQK